MEFSEQILYIRSKNNLSQAALAKELHVSYATISRWENGKSKNFLLLKDIANES